MKDANSKYQSKRNKQQRYKDIFQVIDIPLRNVKLYEPSLFYYNIL
jgi:hypothetical protein